MPVLDANVSIQCCRGRVNVYGIPVWRDPPAPERTGQRARAEQRPSQAGLDGKQGQIGNSASNPRFPLEPFSNSNGLECG